MAWNIVLTYTPNIEYPFHVEDYQDGVRKYNNRHQLYLWGGPYNLKKGSTYETHDSDDFDSNYCEQQGTWYACIHTIVDPSSGSYVESNTIQYNPAQPPGDLVWSYSPTSPVATSVVTFTSSASCPTSWDWDFGDGSAHGTTWNPTHTYASAGTYNVTLTIQSCNGPYSLMKTITVTSDTPPTPPVDTTWDWDFGDGSPHSSLQNPVHIYTTAGTYTVTLKITRGSVVKTVTDTVSTMDCSEPLQAIFSSDVNTGCAPCTVTFKDESEGSPTSWLWDFGDGSTTSTDKNPVHTYSNVGTYDVTLTVGKGSLNSKATETGFIVVDDCTEPLEAIFSSDTGGDCIPSTIKFKDDSTGSPTSWEWDFGDGSSKSTEQNPTHTYTAAGKYDVTLTVKKGTKSNTLKESSFIETVDCSEPLKAIIGSDVAGNCIPFTVHFTDESTGSPTSWLWNFGDGSTSTLKDPSHEYTQERNYTVTLTVKRFNESSTVTEIDYIEGINCDEPLAVFFDGDPLSDCAPLTVQFYDLTDYPEFPPRKTS